MLMFSTGMSTSATKTINEDVVVLELFVACSEKLNVLNAVNILGIIVTALVTLKVKILLFTS